MPALYNLSCQELLPPGFAVGRLRPDADDRCRASGIRWSRASGTRLMCWRFARSSGTSSCRRCTTSRRTSSDRKAISSSARGSAKWIRSAAAPGTGCSTSQLRRAFSRPSSRISTGTGWPVAAIVRAGWTRVVIEKPFGRDLASARASQRYDRAGPGRGAGLSDRSLSRERIPSRTSSPFGLPIRSSSRSGIVKYIDHVQITAAETLGVEHRGRYYEEAGCLRDMFQNHLLQLMALVAMEPPARHHGESTRDRKADVLRAIVPITGSDSCPRSPCAGSTVRATINGQRRAGLSGGERRRRRLQHRDLCRAQADDRQLAMGRRAVLSALGQTDAAEADASSPSSSSASRICSSTTGRRIRSSPTC